jgi:serine protease Do
MNTNTEDTNNLANKRSPNFARMLAAGILAVVICAVALLAGVWVGHTLWPPTEIKPEASAEQVKPNSLPANQALGALGSVTLTGNTIADIAADVAPCVVNIDTRTTVAVSGSPFHMGMPFGQFDFFFGPNQSPFGDGPQKFVQSGSGSGVIIRGDGYILTNNHVVGNANEIKVRLNDKRVFDGKVVGRDSFTDLALVKIDANNLPVARLGSSKNIRPGDWAIAIGSPLGLDHTVTLGIVSALGRSVNTINSNVELIQTDAAINPGNSGGPLLNIKGDVIGINVAIESNAQNIGFAIPVDVATGVVDDLIAHGSISRPYAGIVMQSLDAKLAQSLGLAANIKGVVVTEVVPDSPAQKCGLTQGDVIEKVDAVDVASPKDVQQLVRKHKVGDTVNLLVLRSGKLIAINLQVADYPQKQEAEE